MDVENKNFELFAARVSLRVSQGYLVADRNDKTLVAVLYRPAEKVNHTLHLIITIFTCLLWGLVWFLIAQAAPKERRVRIYVDSTGKVVEELV